MESLVDRIAKLEYEIAELPVGYISNKMINNRLRHYLQWTEDGKKKSKYLDDDTAAVVAEQIEKRRELQKELRIAKAMLPREVKKKVAADRGYNSEILTGDSLRLFVQQSSSLNSRPCLRSVIDFLNGPVNSKVLILYGLRRTGKTTLIQQAISNLDAKAFDKAAFLQVRQGYSLAKVNQDMKRLQAQGFKYVFLDEVTLLEDFIEGAALFSDIYAACGMKIVLSGTDSLGFMFSTDQQLYDRCTMLHTTFIPYKEFESVLGISGIDEYIRYGGTMSLSGIHYNENSTFSSKKNTDEYVDSAIARNIQHSLQYYQDAGHFRHLQDLYDSDELTSAINRVVEDINHRFTIDVLVRDFTGPDAFTVGLKEALEIRNKSEQLIEIRDSHRTEIKEYLDLLDLTVDILVESLPVVNEKEYMTVISQPGLRYSQADALIRQLLQDAVFQSISAVERKRIVDRILNEIKGRMMEEIVLLETTKANPKKEVFKLKFAVGEFDMVVYDPEEVSCEIYEIKHSTEAVSDQYRHLIDEQKCIDTEFRFGSITRKGVIYRGENMTCGEIEYLNVEDYLKGLL